MKPIDRWHEGEKAIQARVGVRQHMEELGKRIVRDHLTDQHRAFFPQLPFVAAGTVDDAGDAWATLLVGEPSFLTSPEPRLLEIASRLSPADPAAGGMREGGAIGLLGIELHTRRRNRANGSCERTARGICSTSTRPSATARSTSSCATSRSFAIPRCSLSVAPSDGVYRISVKREGRVTSFLHDRVAVGDPIEVRGPEGSFTIEALQRRPAVLLAGGIGITPLLAMLRHVVYEGLRKRAIRPTVLFHAVHTQAERAFAEELRELVDRAGGTLRIVRVLGDPAGATEGSITMPPGASTRGSSRASCPSARTISTCAVLPRSPRTCAMRSAVSTSPRSASTLDCFSR